MGGMMWPRSPERVRSGRPFGAGRFACRV